MSILGGALNFGALGGGGGMISASGLPASAGLGAAYQSAYQGALNLNQQNYANILQGYQGLAGAQGQRQQQIQQGYGGLQQGTASILGANYGVPGANNQWGVAAPAAQAIQKLLTSQTGQQFDAQGNPTQGPIGGSILSNLTSRGLGNNTILQSMANQAQGNYGTAIGALGANLGQTYAGYFNNDMLASLGYANQANQQNTALGENQLGFQERVNAPYPNAGAYNSLLQQAGAYAEQQRQQQLQQQYLNRSLALGGYGAAGGGVQIGHMGQLAGANAPMGEADQGGPSFQNIYNQAVSATGQRNQLNAIAAGGQAGGGGSAGFDLSGGNYASPAGQQGLDQYLAAQQQGGQGYYDPSQSYYGGEGG